MKLKSLLATLAVVLVALGFTGAAEAFGDRHKPAGWGHTRHITHHIYYPRYTHHYKVDPYAYQYSPRGYYPYYGSRYWANAKFLKHRNRAHLNHWNTQPPRFRYYKSWGYPRKWHNRKWHHKHHGFHHRWHW